MLVGTVLMAAVKLDPPMAVVVNQAQQVVFALRVMLV